jgi:pimeloyl-ACP methyl ester carboxylesterase
MCAVTAHAQQSLAVGDVTLRYLSTGNGPAVVFIHGWAQSLEIWDDQVRAFAPNYRVIRYDRRGFAKSSGYADATADPADVRALLDSSGVQSAILVGLSAGARVAMDVAVAFPDRVRGLVVYGMIPVPGYPPMPDAPRASDMFGEIARRHGMDSVRRAIMASPIPWVPPGREDLTRAIAAALVAYDGRDLLDPRPESGLVPHARWEQMRRVRVPTLIVNGDHDLAHALAFAAALERELPNARRAIIKDGGHGAHFAQPEPFNRELRQFFASLRP